ncbi:hypothetical protein ACFOON_01170 [Novosphingobium piscinae]|uniref:Antitoxin Xre/MbcA/ParS-like toxin-binding domain-containing protein n=1 Tax=Novosphingobium piscinae TaxID=1507448 RepID=A0A7X1FVU1_9SPHN|nr:hypothetical protein [Novosphingobium piscinae]MBC2667809.1 hypothetical protein [Novosphingobium piscinae]
MVADPPIPDSQSDLSSPARKPGRFIRPRRQPSPLSAEAATRQGTIIRLVCAQISPVDQARLFLNTHHAGLGAVPLNLAGESPAGLAVVAAEVARMSLAARGHGA